MERLIEGVRRGYSLWALLVCFFSFRGRGREWKTKQGVSGGFGRRKGPISGIDYWDKNLNIASINSFGIS